MKTKFFTFLLWSAASMVVTIATYGLTFYMTKAICSSLIIAGVVNFIGFFVFLKFIQCNGCDVPLLINMALCLLMTLIYTLNQLFSFGAVVASIALIALLLPIGFLLRNSINYAINPSYKLIKPILLICLTPIQIIVISIAFLTVTILFS